MILRESYTNEARKSNIKSILFLIDLEVFFQYIFKPTLYGVGFFV